MKLSTAIRRLAGVEGIDYRAKYPARVLKDHGGNKFDIRCDDERLGDLVRIRLHTAVPDMIVRVKVGARVLLGFAAASPQKPILEYWESGKSERIEFGVGAKDAARKDDTVEVTIPSNTVLIQVPNPSGVPPFLQIPNPQPIVVTGKITSGSSLMGVADA